MDIKYSLHIFASALLATSVLLQSYVLCKHARHINNIYDIIEARQTLKEEEHKRRDLPQLYQEATSGVKFTRVS